MKKVVSFLVILLSLMLVVGCGGDEGKVKSTAKKIVSAAKKGNFDKVLKYAPKETREEFKKDKKKYKEFKKEFKKEMVKELKGAKFKYGDVEIDGDKATIEVTMIKDGEEDTDKLDFKKEKGKWVMDGFFF